MNTLRLVLTASVSLLALTSSTWAGEPTTSGRALVAPTAREKAALDALHPEPPPVDASPDGDDDDRIRDITGALDEVWWTVDSEATVAEVSGAWGIRSHSLIKLNPELGDREQTVPAGTRLCVFRRDPEAATLSIERPTDGKLRRGVAFPEGDGWVSPSHRFQWGTQLAVVTLVEVLEQYRATYPDADPIRVGDLSRRRGGEIERRHESHQSGRDVDLGYPRFDEVSADEVDNPPVTADTLDVEKTWSLIETLLATERVQVIFMDKEVQKLLEAHVSDQFTKEELAMLFEHPRRVHSHRAIIQHWKHHDDHFHVRFVCDPGNWRCRGNGVWGVE